MSTPEEMLRLAGGLARGIWHSEPDEATSAAGLAVVEAMSHPPEERLGVLPTITRRRVIDALRRAYGRNGERPKPSALPESYEVPARVDDPEELALAAHEASRALAVLTERERYIVSELAEGRTLREVGEELGITEAAVCVARRKARQRAQGGLNHEERDQ